MELVKWNLAIKSAKLFVEIRERKNITVIANVTFINSDEDQIV